ncbi:hypothetical protein [uncultured Psychroserpens sp.]|uniref:hypothetical protein n=1 Tax=uncultured Psychroserpens sp. TaxID=255436 RepID=UPI00262B7065|nr:hypothetical protein [uncultured Psychroserpens sp.]
MSEKKNIDKLFKEQLKDFEVAPPEAVWENIEQELHKDKRKRRVIPIWWRLAGVAAALLLLFTVGNTLFNTNGDNTIEQEVVDTDKSNTNSTNDSNDAEDPSDLNSSSHQDKNPIVDNDSSEDGENTHNSSEQLNDNLTTTDDSTTKTNVASSNEDEKKSSSKNSSLIKNKSLKENAVANQNNTKLNNTNKDKTKASIDNEKNAVVNNSNTPEPNKNIDLNPVKKEKSEIDKLIKETSSSKETQVTSANNSEKENGTTTIDTSKTKDPFKEVNAIDKAIAEAEQNKDEVDETEEPIKRWSIAPNVAPVYFNTLGKGSPIDDQFINNTKEGDINVSYGVKGSYAINKKLKIRAGINKVDLGYTTNNVVAFSRPSSSGSSRQLQNIKLHDTTTTFISANSISYTTGPEILFTKEQGSIDQQLGFIEVPIEVEYNLIDKKIGLNLIGGFSTLFLSNNEIYSVQNNGDRALLGEATNINDMSYSANFGIGVNYNISKQLRFNLEPTFKYQINTFNDTSGDFQPFFIGVYTGLSFKF